MTPSKSKPIPSSISPSLKENWEWRRNDDEDDEEEGKKPKVRTNGVSPQRFHATTAFAADNSSSTGSSGGKSSRQRRRSRHELALHASIQNQYVRYQQNRVSQKLEVKWSAFRTVTCLKTHPLQEMAIHHYRDLLRIHLGEEADTITTAAAGTKSDHANFSEESSSLVSVSSGFVSIDADVERKRCQRDPILSPTKSRLKASFRNEFLDQQRLSKPIVLSQASSVLGPALWCMEPRVFSVEKSQTGKRKYLTTHFGRFADLYWRKLDPRSRNYYEVILEHTPCRLYLDLEFPKTAQAHERVEHGEALLDELFLELQEELYSVFPDQMEDLQRSHIVDLDSSTSKKFSRHWIIHSGKYLFADTRAVGQFVTNWIGRLANEHATKQLAAKDRPILQSYLFDSTTACPHEQSCLVDMGVYTKNRLFRILGSCKFGKNPQEATLRIADRNEFPLSISNDAFIHPLILKESTESLSSPSTSNKETIDVDTKVEHFVQATNWTVHAHALAETLVIPLNSTKLDYATLPYDKTASTGNMVAPSDNNAGSNGIIDGFSTGRSRRSARPTSSRGPSPFPMLDDFVVSVLCRRGCDDGSAQPGTIRTWSIERAGNGQSCRAVTYFIAGNRWCENMGRAHKSNGIYWMIDAHTFTCTQACFDPDCRAFRGIPVPLPGTVRSEFSEALFEEALASMSLDSPTAHLNKNECTKASSKFSSIPNQESISDEALLNALTSNPEQFP